MSGAPMNSSSILRAFGELMSLAEGVPDGVDVEDRIAEIASGLGDTVPAKLDGISYVVDRMQGQVAQWREWEKELAGKRRAVDATVERLKLTAAALLTASEAAGFFLDKKTGRVKVCRDHGAVRSHWLAKVEVVEGPDDVSLWPQEWTTTTTAASRSAAMEAISATGEVPDGFEVVTRRGWRSQ
jgi:hypothetical protein